MLWHSGDKEAGEDVKQTRDEGMGCENSLCDQQLILSSHDIQLVPVSGAGHPCIMGKGP